MYGNAENPLKAVFVFFLLLFFVFLSSYFGTMSGTFPARKHRKTHETTSSFLAVVLLQPPPQVQSPISAKKKSHFLQAHLQRAADLHDTNSSACPLATLRLAASCPTPPGLLSHIQISPASRLPRDSAHTDMPESIVGISCSLDLTFSRLRATDCVNPDHRLLCVPSCDLQPFFFQRKGDVAIPRKVDGRYMLWCVPVEEAPSKAQSHLQFMDWATNI